MFNISNKFCIMFFEKFNLQKKVLTPFGNITFATPNELTFWRAETLLTKEPDTIEWIQSFKSDDILFDIGANVALYSLCAAKQGAQVFCFEPEAQNYALINKNIYLNNLDNKVRAFNMAISNSTKVDALYISKITIGGALNNFGDNLDYNRNKFKESFRQGVLAVSIDDLIEKYSFPVPTYIKIDVDGLEPDIVDGAIKTLANPNLKSLLIELNTGITRDLETIKTIEKLGFKCISKLQPKECIGTDFANIFNFIFVRTS